MKNIFLFLILSVLVLNNVSADEITKSAKSAILMEASTGKIIYEYNADEALAPASMTKIMTLLLTMEKIESGDLKLDDLVTVSKLASDMGGSQVFLEENAQYKLEDIIKAVCIASGNDASVVLAETVGGSVDNFVKMMNDKAKTLGLTSTNFVNPYGLDAEGHLSSARDMAIMARELVKHELILKYSSIYEEYLKKVDGTNLWMVNTNKLVRFYQGVDGLKTGYTNNAGYCLTATGKWNGMRIISVVMGEPSHEERTKDTTALLNYGKSLYKIKTILKKDKILDKVKLDLGKNREVDLVSTNDITDLVKNSDKQANYTYKISKKELKLPLKKGDKVGTITIYKDGKILKQDKITVRNNVDKCSILTLFSRIFSLIIIGNR